MKTTISIIGAENILELQADLIDQAELTGVVLLDIVYGGS